MSSQLFPNEAAAANAPAAKSQAGCEAGDVDCPLSAPRHSESLEKAVKAAQKPEQPASEPAKVPDGQAVKVPAKELSLRDLIGIVGREVQTNGRNLNKDLVRQAMENYNGDEWKRFAFFDAERGYTRNLIATDHETFGLMLLCWTPGRFSPVHDHSGSHCFMRCISQTPVEERRYRTPSNNPDDPLELVTVCQIGAGQVAYICDDIGLHSVGNPDEKEYAVTLHLYMPPFDSCKCFMDLTGQGCEADITYYSENGELVVFDDLEH